MKQKLFDCDVEIWTDGLGLWTSRKEPVRITGVSIEYIDRINSYVELDVHLDTTTWNTKEFGLIYTDRLFLKGLRQLLTSKGLDGDAIDYTEQGMQGDSYVSIEAGATFIDTLANRFPTKFKCICEYYEK